MGPEGIGTLVRRFRCQARLTQYELSEISTVSVRAIRDLENGRVERPRQETVRLIANGLHLGESQRLVLHAACGGSAKEAAAKLISDAAPIEPPARINGLSGREAEVQTVVEAMTRDHNRWMTITGLNGVGKTSVALDVAHTLHKLHSYSTLWVSLGAPGPHTDGSDRFRVDSAVVAEVSRIGEHLMGDEFDARQLVQMIGQRRTLLVLDGCDLKQIGADRVLALLAGCHGLRVLVTTRDSGATPGEHLLPLEPLDVPACETNPPARAEHHPAVQLMLSHIRRLQPRAADTSAATVGHLVGVCRALDCIPAALKLGAEWGLVLSPVQLLERARRDPLSLLISPTVGGAGPALRQTLEQSVRTVTATDRQLLGLLAPLRTGWTVQDVARLAGIDEPDSARRVWGLLVRGLIRRVDGSAGSHFRVLNLVARLFEMQEPETVH
ncbi:NB-ARC domain-containing protein [Streptomyces sp. NRRL B-24085]|uniref:NB-ARC domain-containing protein n=1 Tax=Streptomyces sp. NRRL B-24085 TaxID=1709476 RepID=UPI0006B37F34|nr:NB-ARC domain-containing protein [Streptomyces sp. NRRL B-24085]